MIYYENLVFDKPFYFSLPHWNCLGTIIDTSPKEMNDKLPEPLATKFREWRLSNKTQLTRDVMHYVLEPTSRVSITIVISKYISALTTLFHLQFVLL